MFIYTYTYPDICIYITQLCLSAPSSPDTYTYTYIHIYIRQARMGTVMLGKLADKINPMLSPLFTSPSPPTNFQGAFKAAALAEIAQLFAGGLRPSKKKRI
jgi:hypothetical protein